MWEAHLAKDFQASILIGKGLMVKRALQLFVEMQQKGLQPDVITYTAVITACAKGGMAKRALQLFDAMRHHGLQPNVITYNAVISACGKGLMAKRAL